METVILLKNIDSFRRRSIESVIIYESLNKIQEPVLDQKKKNGVFLLYPDKNFQINQLFGISKFDSIMFRTLVTK